jgi:hypothetical protein
MRDCASNIRENVTAGNFPEHWVFRKPVWIALPGWRRLLGAPGDHHQDHQGTSPAPGMVPVPRPDSGAGDRDRAVAPGRLTGRGYAPCAWRKPGAFLTDRAPARPKHAPMARNVPVPTAHRIEMIRRSPHGHRFAAYGGKVQHLPTSAIQTTPTIVISIAKRWKPESHAYLGGTLLRPGSQGYSRELFPRHQTAPIPIPKKAAGTAGAEAGELPGQPRSIRPRPNSRRAPTSSPAARDGAGDLTISAASCLRDSPLW